MNIESGHPWAVGDATLSAVRGPHSSGHRVVQLAPTHGSNVNLKGLSLHSGLLCDNIKEVPVDLVEALDDVNRPTAERGVN